VVRSINDLTERHGFGPMASARRPTFSAFSLRDDPDGLWVGEEAGQMLGFAFSWVCRDFWFLAQLFVSPGQQGREIGNQLLKRTLDHARKRGATNRALITFALIECPRGCTFGTGYSHGFRCISFLRRVRSWRAHLRASSYSASPLSPRIYPISCTLMH